MQPNSSSRQKSVLNNTYLLLSHSSYTDPTEAMIFPLKCLTYRVCIQQVKNKRPFPFLISPSANHTRHTSARINGCYRNHHFWNRQTQCLWRTQPSQSSVKSVILGLRKCLWGQAVPRNQTDWRRGHDISHLRESILTVQNEELPLGPKVVLEDPPLGVESNWETSVKCYKTGSIIQWVKVWDLGSDNPSFKFCLYTYSLRNAGQVTYPSVSQLLIYKMEIIIVPISWD